MKQNSKVRKIRFIRDQADYFQVVQKKIKSETQKYLTYSTFI